MKTFLAIIAFLGTSAMAPALPHERLREAIANEPASTLPTIVMAQASSTGSPSSEALSAEESQRIARFNALMWDANTAAMRGDFETAISLWQQTIPFEPELPNMPECKGELQRVAIMAANDTIVALRNGTVTQAQAPKWFQDRETELWMPNACNTP